MRTDGASHENVGVIVIHGVGEAELGWINEFLVKPLECDANGEANSATAGVARRLVFDLPSEIYNLEVKDKTTVPPSDCKFSSCVRHARFEGKPVAFIELLWADLSRVGTGQLSRLFAFIRLFFEAPQVFSEAMLKGSRGFFYRALRSFITLVNLWLRWVIGGFNIATIAVSVLLLGLERLGVFKPYLELPGNAYLVVSFLFFLCVVVFGILSTIKDDRGIHFSEVWLASALSAAILLIFVLIDLVHGVATNFTAHQAKEELLRRASDFILWMWFFWNIAVSFLVLIVCAIGLKRLILTADASAPRLQQLASTTAVIIVQGVFWKIAITIVWIFVILNLVPEILDPAAVLEPGVEAASKGAVKAKECVFGSLDWKASGDLTKLPCAMLSISALNIISSAEILLAVGLVIACRIWLRRSKPDQYRIEQGTYATVKGVLPRLIASRWVMAVILAGYIVNQIAYYVGKSFDVDLFGFYKFHVDNYVAGFFGWALGSKLYGMLQAAVVVGGGLPATMAGYRYIREAMGRDKEVDTGLLHIARDLVDHQYPPPINPLTQIVRPFLVRTKVATGDPGARYPRRARIHDRLDKLLNEVAARHAFDRLIFVTHSQGTVIAIDYLRARHKNGTLDGVKRIDVVTLASPLTHVYRHYFHDYLWDLPGPGALHPKLASWINMWRVDDPIGNRVDAIEGGFVYNETLGEGGHVNYWKEKRVCEVVLDLILDPDAVRGPERKQSRVRLFECYP